MFYVYILRSMVKKVLYIGFTNNLKLRVQQHNDGKSNFTRKFRPWKLAYYEAYASEKEARERERQLKKFANAYIQLKRRIKDSIEG